MIRPPLLRASFDPGHELAVDNFAGGGGASTGIEAALGRPIDVAVNHDPEAIAVHEANHPGTKHYCEDVWTVDPTEACGGRPVGVAWFSPDCTHFSRAKGAKPRKKEIRALANVVLRWGRAVGPRLIFLENVEEFQTWGPLDDEGYPIKAKAGADFRAWLQALRNLGYRVEFRSLVAADFGAPTTRKRLYLVARRDDAPIVWPDKTHGAGLEPWRPAAEVIDWSLPCPSIFERKRPLAPATVARLARGLQRYVIEHERPFLIPAPDERGEYVSPFIVRHGHYSKRTGAGIRPGCGAGTFRGQPLKLPLATVCATNDKHVVAPFLTKFYGTSTGSPMRRPVPTVTAGGGHLGHVNALLAQHDGPDAKVLIDGETYVIADIGMRMLQPHELFAAQGFPPGYVIDPQFNGKPLTKTAQHRLAGNSVCPPVAEQIVRANLAA